MKSFNAIKVFTNVLITKVLHVLPYLILFNAVSPIPAISAVLDWDTNAWPSPVSGTPTLSQTYSVGGSNIDITFSGNTAQLVTTGSPISPETNQYLTGGTTNEDALFVRTDFVNTTQNVVITLDFSHPGGVSDLSFTVWDIDADEPQWVDQVQVTAIAGGSPVNPSSITDGVTNAPGINTSTGSPIDNNNAANNSSDGNATFTFNQTGITQVTIVYSNVTPGTPGNQWISIHDISFDIPPTVTKQFSPDPITAGGVSTLTISLSNNDSSTATLTANLVDNLPAGVTVANPANIGGTCPGTTNAPVGGSTITYTNGSTIPSGGCTINVDVTSNTTGTVSNTITAGALQTNLGNNPAAASDDLAVNPPVAPTVSKAFSPDPISINGTSTLTVNLGNTNTITATLTADLVDSLPTNVVVANPANIGGTCPGTTNAPIGGGTITYTNGSSIPAGGCTITVDVTSATAGVYTNTIPTGALQSDLGNNTAAASDNLTVNSTTPPTVTKSFNPNTINPGGTSQLTITLGNINVSTITLLANMDDNLPIGVTATAINAATTCPGAVDISVNTRVRYPTGATIPSGGCNIVVDVTSNTLGVVTNTILTGALQTDVGSNANPASDNLTVTSGGGAPTCPAGTTLVNLGTPRNADAVVAGNPFNPAQALGAILPVNSGLNNGNSARLVNTRPTMTLDLTDTVPENGTIILSIARNNNPGNYNIDSSINVAGPFGGLINFSAGPNDISQQVSYTVPTGGIRYVRFTRNSGSLWVDGVQYSQICEIPPTADLVITKDDSSATYTPGGTSTYVLTITNNGPDAVTGASIQDLLPNGVTLSAQWSCSATAGSNCSAASGGTVGGSIVSLTADILNGGVITVNVPVQFSANMGDY